MSTVTEFRARFPQLANLPDLTIQFSLTDAMACWDIGLPNWGAIICYQAAHSITVQSIAMADESEMVRTGKLTRYNNQLSIGEGNLHDTQYGRELIRITSQHCGGGFGILG